MLATLAADLAGNLYFLRSNNMSVYSGRWPITLINTCMEMDSDSILEMLFLLMRL
jgi:hypothetical protein